jgi:hypothetical protein
MNERIRELAEQAGYSKDFLAVGLPNNMEKFAELIVRECVNIAKDVNRNPYLPDGEQARQIIKNITKHFGVGE